MPKRSCSAWTRSGYTRRSSASAVAVAASASGPWIAAALSSAAALLHEPSCAGPHAAFTAATRIPGRSRSSQAVASAATVVFVLAISSMIRASVMTW